MHHDVNYHFSHCIVFRSGGHDREKKAHLFIPTSSGYPQRAKDVDKMVHVLYLHLLCQEHPELLGMVSKVMPSGVGGSSLDPHEMSRIKRRGTSPVRTLSRQS